MASLDQRFWAKVQFVLDKTSCWLWVAGKSGETYGCFRYASKRIGAHRFAYASVKQDPSGLVVRHRCDTPLCCRSSHLELGEHADNVADRANQAAGAICVGSRNGIRSL